MLLSSKNGTTMPKPSYHQVAAPWKIYSELAEAIMGLGAEIKRQEKESSAMSDMGGGSFGNFVGSNAAGKTRLRNELQRDYKGKMFSLWIYCFRNHLLASLTFNHSNTRSHST
jgi:hypothetical protein